MVLELIPGGLQGLSGTVSYHPSFDNPANFRHYQESLAGISGFKRPHYSVSQSVGA